VPAGGAANALLRNAAPPPPQQFDDVLVCQNDIAGFTQICSKNEIESIVLFLDNLFTTYDSIISQFGGVHPVTRIGDAYQVRAAGGAGRRSVTHTAASQLVAGVDRAGGSRAELAADLARAALLIIDAVRRLSFSYLKEVHEHVKIRTGIGCGRCAVGILGLTVGGVAWCGASPSKFRARLQVPTYTISGEAVDVAAAMEANSRPYDLLVSQTAYDMIKQRFDFDPVVKTVS